MSPDSPRPTTATAGKSRPVRRTAGRAAAATFGTLALTAAAVVGAQAALATPTTPAPTTSGAPTTTCTSNPVARTLDFVLSLRALSSDGSNCTK